ncbi:MAG: conjugal transfer protein TraW [Sphingobacteriaceae bacterium]|nr:MAG: conjugal transfer protein TraW [Sphingobacteriaceae bacterium]
MSYAHDFGKRGTTFEIKEEGFLKMIKRKLAVIDHQAEHQKMKNFAKKRIENPTAVKGIHRAEEKRIFYHDPSYMSMEDIVLPCGKILHRAGTNVNPLDHIKLERRLFFVDGRDTLQIKWLKDKLTEKSKDEQLIQNRTILIGGRILDLQNEIGQSMYFDQAGELTNKFGIKAVPAIVEQEGNRLKIVEVKID